MQKESSFADISAKQLVEMAISCGRSWQSPQTGYIHYSYSQQDEEFHHAIPLYENFLYILALMRAKRFEEIGLAKESLSRLLYFQNEMTEGQIGNFPLNLHEFPHCFDRSQAVRILPIFYWIFKNFQHVLGADLKKRLAEAIRKALSYSLNAQMKRAYPYPTAIKLAASALAIGKLFEDKDYIAQGEGQLQILERNPALPDWNSPSSLAEILTAFQMLYPSLSKSPEGEFWKHITSTWHALSASYCGPSWQEFQRAVDPQPTLYDYFMGYFGRKYSYRSYLDHPVQLQAALVHASDDEIEAPSYPVQQAGHVQNVSWRMHQDAKWALCALATSEEAGVVQNEKGRHALKLIWGGGCLVHTLVCQAAGCSAIEMTKDGRAFTLLITLPPPPPEGIPEKNQEISFFVDQAEALQIAVEGLRSTAFNLNDRITLRDENLDITLNFEVVEGKASFFGHIMRGNRISQQLRKGIHRFEAYDWQIFLRSIIREGACKIKVQITITP